MSALTSSTTLPPVLLPLPARPETLFRFFEDSIRPIPPVGILTKRIFWIQFCYQGLIRTIFYLFYRQKIEAARTAIATSTPDKIYELAIPYAKWLPDFAFLAICYGKEEGKIQELKTTWLLRGYILFSDILAGSTEKAALTRNLLEPYADLICFQAETLSESQRLEKAIQLLKIASSSLRKDNAIFVAQAVIETFFALFPLGIPTEESQFLPLLDQLTESAKAIGGEKVGTLFDDYLLIFVKYLLKKSGEPGTHPMHAIRHHINNGDQKDSELLLRYLTDPKWDTFCKNLELLSIRKAISQSETLQPKALLLNVFRALHTNGIHNLSPVASLYLFPAPWREHVSAHISPSYFAPFGIPVGEKGLFSAVYISGAVHSIHYLFFDKEGATIPPPFETTSPIESSHFELLRAFETSLSKLNTPAFIRVLNAIKEGFQKDLDFWLNNTEINKENLSKLAECYTSFVQLEELGHVGFIKEMEYVRNSLASWMKAYWLKAYPKATSIDYSKYKGHLLLKQVPRLITLL